MSEAKTICTVCNYIYDEALGEPSQHIPPTPRFVDLPDEWRCPECGSAKDMFQPCSCISVAIYEQTRVVQQGSDCSSKVMVDNPEGGLSKTTPVGEVVAQCPSGAAVLEEYGIDYCCGGKTTVEDACRQKGLEVEKLLERLFAADRKNVQSSGPDWKTASLKDLIDHIVTKYHQPLRQELLRVAELAEKVAQAHAKRHSEMIEVLSVFNRFRAELELHMQKEEMVLFPGIVSMEATSSPLIFGCGGGIEHPIEVMSREHDAAGEALCTMRRLTHDYTPPDDACSSFKDLLYSLSQIESEMHQHVHKENNILFPRALELSSQAATAR